jgi:secreted trypsin-like serine protease
LIQDISKITLLYKHKLSRISKQFCFSLRKKLIMKVLVLLCLAVAAIAHPMDEGFLYTKIFENPEDAVHNFWEADEEFMPQILNGNNANLGQFPFVARMSIQRGGSTGLCSASVIHANYLLSASHCVNSNPGAITNIGFLLGVVNRNTQTGVTHNSAQMWWHPQPATLVQDIALFRTVNLVQTTPNIAPVHSIPSRAQTGEEFVGAQLTLIGWGVDNTGGVAVHLQWAHFRALSIGQCTAAFTVWEICYVHDGNNAQSQGGDSGGPVVIQNFHGAGQHLQVGIHAGRRFSGGMVFHSAARVSQFLDWIQERANFVIT